MDSRTILKKLDHIEDLPTLPTIAMEVNNMLQDYDVSIKKLSQTIEKDQALVPRILKLVNSAFFGFRSKVSNIPHAIILLGFNTVRNALLSLSIIDVFSGKAKLEGFDITDFWRHSIAVAVTSTHLAEKSRLHSPEEAFTAGLLHDMGQIVLYQVFQDLFHAVWTIAKEKNLCFYDAEKKAIPVSHAQIGGHLAKKWQLPAGLVDTIRYHHSVSKGANDPSLVKLVHTADIIVNRYMFDRKDNAHFSKVHPDALRVLKPQIYSASEWFPEIFGEIESACHFFLEESGK